MNSSIKIEPFARLCWQKRFIFISAILALLIFSNGAWASDGSEFTEAVSQWEKWIQGNFGKLAALVCLAIGLVVAALRKDWTWLAGSMILAMGTGVIVGIIKGSFTATI